MNLMMEGLNEEGLSTLNWSLKSPFFLNKNRLESLFLGCLMLEALHLGTYHLVIFNLFGAIK